MIRCNKCYMLKIDEKSKCACNIKKFDEAKLSKKTREEKAPTPIKQISEKKQERLKDNGSEGELFKKIYKKLAKSGNHKCMICQKIVLEDEVSPSSFPHILPKSKFPEYRYFENNIGFVCGISHHQKFDDSINNYKQDKGLLELETQIKNGKIIDITKYIDV